MVSLSAGNATRLGSLTMGWREAGPIPRLSKGKRVSPGTGWRILTAFFGVTPNPFNRIDRRAKRSGTLGRDITLSASPRPAAMAALIRRLDPDGRIRQVRDEQYFAWRFRQPRGVYRFLYKGESELEGYLVLQAKAHVPGAAVSIADCEPPAGPVTRALLHAALDAADLGRVRMWSPGSLTDTLQTTRRLGMRPVPIKSFAEPFQSFLLRPATARVPPRPWLLAGRDVLDLANWDLRQLYSDGF
jgi:hypothetical protein